MCTFKNFEENAWKNFQKTSGNGVYNVAEN